MYYLYFPIFKMIFILHLHFENLEEKHNKEATEHILNLPELSPHTEQ